MSKLEDFAQEIAQEVYKDKDSNDDKLEIKTVDPVALTMIIIQIILFIIGQYKKQNPSAAYIREKVKNLNIIQRFLLRLNLRRYMKENSDNYELYADRQNTLFKHSLNKLKTVNEDVVKSV